LAPEQTPHGFHPRLALQRLPTPLTRQNVDLVRLLLAQKDISLNDINGDGYSALAIAKEKGNSTIADLLLRAGADPQLVMRRPPPHDDEVASN